MFRRIVISFYLLVHMLSFISLFLSLIAVSRIFCVLEIFLLFYSSFAYCIMVGPPKSYFSQHIYIYIFIYRLYGCISTSIIHHVCLSLCFCLIMLTYKCLFGISIYSLLDNLHYITPSQHSRKKLQIP